MGETQAEIVPVQLALHDNEDVPREFIVDLLGRVFGKSDSEAASVMAAIEKHAMAVCGPYPPSVADALLESARRRISITGHALRITRETAKPCCGLCGQPTAQSEVQLTDRTVWLCADCMLAAAAASLELPEEEFNYAFGVLNWHFADTPRSQLVTTVRQFPGHMRADVQAAIDRLFAAPVRLLGLADDRRYETLSMSRLMQDDNFAVTIAWRTDTGQVSR
ncbi:ATP-dependent Clp protease adaptor ClpS [Bradyrhizobium cosmicum]|uniref:ATP-dependent Clp protease adaptor ClpS n=1 Tax=Bradyrhizobium cosmicum TaxID=1404864 RepID=UPI0028E5214F|nr:ATP-dependent Clp protease adaptor ClpS [Bradyrhizobium cosmicum]